VPYRDERLALLQRQEVLAAELSRVGSRLAALGREPSPRRWLSGLLVASMLVVLAVPVIILSGRLDAHAAPRPDAVEALLMRLVAAHAALPPPGDYLVDDIVAAFGVELEAETVVHAPCDSAHSCRATKGALEYVLPRAFVDQLLDSAQLHSPSSVRPHVQDGKVVCLKIHALRANSPWRHLGLREGDCLESVSGYSLTDPQRALEAYARLRRCSCFTLGLRRKGRQLTIGYHIVETPVRLGDDRAPRH